MDFACPNAAIVHLANNRSANSAQISMYRVKVGLLKLHDLI